MKKNIHLILVFIFFEVLCMTKTAVCQNEVRIDVKEGTFLFKNLSLESDKYSPAITLKGQAVNNTTKNWRKVDFIIGLWDINGIKLIPFVGNEPFTLSFYDLMRNESQEIEHGHGKRFSVKRSTPTIEEEREKSDYLKFMKGLKVEAGKYEISFNSGSYLASLKLVMSKPVKSENLLFEDSFLKIIFLFSEDEIAFSIHNKTSDVITIDWNQVSYIDAFGKSHKVIHSGVKFIDKDRSQVPTTIPPNAHIEDVLVPSDYIRYIGVAGLGWSKGALFPSSPEEAMRYKGRSVAVFMPLRIKGATKNYNFTFTIKDVEA
jgi:hypothetical protein